MEDHEVDIDAFRAAMGESAMEAIDVVNDDLVQQLAVVWEACARLAEMMVGGGREPISVVSHITSYVTGLLIETLYGS